LEIVLNPRYCKVICKRETLKYLEINQPFCVSKEITERYDQSKTRVERIFRNTLL